MGPGLLHGVPQPCLGMRVLTPDVEVALLRAARVTHDRDGFQQGERVFLHQHPVLESPRLGFVGVADDVVRLDRVGGHRLPFHPGRERRPAAAEQVGVLQFPDHALRAQAHRPSQHLVTAGGPVGIQRARIYAPHLPQQPERGAVVSGLRDERAGVRAGLRRGEGWPHLVGAERGQHYSGRIGACVLDHGRRSSIALAQARAALPGDTGAVGFGASALGPEPVLHLLADLLRAVHLAGEVVADVDHCGRSRAGAEQGVKRRHPVGLGRRDGEPGADVIERPRADPAGPFLYRVEHRQQQVPPGPGGMAAVRDMPVGRRPLAPLPAGRRRAEHRVNGGTLVVGGWCRGPEPQVH